LAIPDSGHLWLYWMVHQLDCHQNAFPSPGAQENYGDCFPRNFPKKTEKLGKLVSDELLSFQDIAAKIADPANVEQLLPFIDAHIDQFLKVKLKETMPVVGMFIGDKTVNQLKAVFLEELTLLFPKLMEQYMGNLQEQLDLEKIVIEKVQGFSTEKLEDILQQIMSKEFRFVEIIGAVLGFLIGLMQVAITLFTT
jgi:uncharacterized membrane protein YheB (UPF0754 family)